MTLPGSIFSETCVSPNSKSKIRVFERTAREALLWPFCLSPTPVSTWTDVSHTAVSSAKHLQGWASALPAWRFQHGVSGSGGLIYRMPSRFARGTRLDLFGGEMRTVGTYYRGRRQQVEIVLGMQCRGWEAERAERHTAFLSASGSFCIAKGDNTACG